MAKTATKLGASSKPTSPAPKSPTVPKTDAPATLPKSLVNALPTSASVMSDMASIDKLIPALFKELEAAKRAGTVPLARAYVVLHRMQSRIEEILRPLDAKIKQFKELDIPEAFEQAGVPSITLDEGFRVGISVRTLASIKPGQKEAAIAWLQEIGKADIVQETINSSTLSAFAKEMGEDNKDLPDDIFNVARVPNTSVTATK